MQGSSYKCSAMSSSSPFSLSAERAHRTSTLINGALVKMGLDWSIGVFGLEEMTHLSNDIIPAESIFIHDGDDNGGLPQLLCWDVKDEGLIEDRVQAPFHHYCLLLLYSLVFVHQPHLHIGVWHRKEKSSWTWKCYSLQRAEAV